MNYIATIGEREIKVTVEEVGVARYVVTGDGKGHMVDAHQVQDSVWSILYGTNSFEVDVQRRGDEYEVLIDGDCYKFTLMNEQLKALSRAGGKAAAGKALVTSPMPGKGGKLLVAAGGGGERGAGGIGGGRDAGTEGKGGEDVQYRGGAGAVGEGGAFPGDREVARAAGAIRKALRGSN